MRRGTLTLLFFIILLALGASYVVSPDITHNQKPLFGWTIPFTTHLGLDLQGGVRVLMQPSPGQPAPTADVMETARKQIEQRVNGGLGVNEPVVRVQSSGNSYSILVELPGLTSGNQSEAIQTLQQRGLLEFWDTGTQQLQEGATLDPTQFADKNPGGKGIFSGKDLNPADLGVGQDQQSGQYLINFGMQGDAIGKFSSYTAKNVNNFLTITLDKKVLTSAVIRQPLPGKGDIQGSFTFQQAQDLTNILKYGALPVQLDISSLSSVGPTLGQDSINKSLIAAGVGLGIVILFMLFYYRLPGLLADIALILYTLLSVAIFKVIGVTLTLAGIAGFILSIGMAVDANILIFERVKEELRDGRLLSAAIDQGWKRAWPSIRDSNISTLITCAVLYFFGNNFGATIIVGFATTLFLGVVVSMFTAIIVTRTFLNLLVPTGVINHPALFGLPANTIATPALARRNSTV